MEIEVIARLARSVPRVREIAAGVAAASGIRWLHLCRLYALNADATPATRLEPLADAGLLR